MSASPIGLDLDRLAPFLAAHAPVAGPLSGRLIAGGRSNLTYLVTDGTTRWVVRRPPLGHVLASAHDMGREFRVMSALASSPVPVPATVASCADDTVIGAPFYVMSYVDGLIVRSRDELAALCVEGRDELVLRTLATTLATLHTVDPAAVGLGDFGRPDGYAERQVRTWTRQLAASRTRELPGLDELAERLAADVPAGERTAIVHGDYRIDNCLLDPSFASVRAVLDWEMSTLGDPLVDLASLVMWWDGLAGLDSPVAAVPGDHLDASSDVAVAAYAEASGRDAEELRTRLRWYTAFSFFKLAGICEGIHYRHLQGATVGEGFDRIGELTLPAIERGLAQL